MRRGHAVFDLDGTLVDSVAQFTAVLNAMLSERGIVDILSPDAVRPHATMGGLAMIEGLLGRRCGDPADALAEFRARYGAAPTPADSLYPGAIEALESLRRDGVTLAVFSNKPQHLCEKVLGDLGLVGLFDAIVGSGPGVPHKPDPAGLDLALERTGGTRSRCCYVGDSAPDHALARAAGVPMVFVAWGYGEPPREGARLAASFAETPALVLDALAARGDD